MAPAACVLCLSVRRPGNYPSGWQPDVSAVFTLAYLMPLPCLYATDSPPPPYTSTIIERVLKQGERRTPVKTDVVSR